MYHGNRPREKNRPKEVIYRIIDFTNETRSKFKNNKVVSYHYTLINAIPKTLFQEFHNISYFWYITLVGLEFSPYSTSSSIRLGIFIPLLALIASSIAINLYQSYEI